MTDPVFLARIKAYQGYLKLRLDLVVEAKKRSFLPLRVETIKKKSITNTSNRKFQLQIQAIENFN